MMDLNISAGGVIYIGVSRRGMPRLYNYAKLLEDIPNKIRNAMGIICDVQLHDVDEKKYISIKVNPYSVAVSLRGRYYYRSGSTKMEHTWEQLFKCGCSMTNFLFGMKADCHTG